MRQKYPYFDASGYLKAERTMPSPCRSRWSQLEAWTDRLLSARTLAEVFELTTGP